MIFQHHLKKLSQVKGQGDRFDYYRLIGLYCLEYLLQRPFLFSSPATARYKNDKKLFYTVLTGNYDQLNEIPPGTARSAGWDFICFTDNPRLTSSSWTIRLIENDHGLDPVRLSRLYKINNHLIDAGYTISIYTDANIRIRADLDRFLGLALPEKSIFSVLYHPFHSSLADEVELCIRTGRDDPDLLKKHYNYYTVTREFSDPYPHINARMLIRRTGNLQLQALMETWFAQLIKWSCRDQVSFNFSLNQHPEVVPHYIPYWMFRCHFKKMDHLHRDVKRNDDA